MMKDMFVIDVDRKEISEEFPAMKAWMKKINKLKLGEGEFDKKEAEFYYTYGFFVGKSKNTTEALQEAAEITSKMLFDERLAHELTKIRVYITMKAGEFMITDKLPKGTIPEKVKKVVAEVTKVKMSIESEYYQNQEVKDSIPEIDRSIVNVEVTRKSKEEGEEPVRFEIDAILEKISKNGYDSLSEDEKTFLDKKSREL